jgi:hypothetical protein
VKVGDVVSVIISKGTLAFAINKKTLGVAFKNPKLKAHNLITPCVFLSSSNDKVEILPGAEKRDASLIQL